MQSRSLTDEDRQWNIFSVTVGKIQKFILPLKVLNKQVELFQVGKAVCFKAVTTITCNKLADSVDQISDCTFCGV